MRSMIGASLVCDVVLVLERNTELRCKKKERKEKQEFKKGRIESDIFYFCSLTGFA